MPNGSSDSFDLKCFLDAQRDCYEEALVELREGPKETHWSWFFFPNVLVTCRVRGGQFWTPVAPLAWSELHAG